MIRKNSGKGGSSSSNHNSRQGGDPSAEAAARLADYTGEHSAPLAGHASLGPGQGLPGSPESDVAAASPGGSPGAGAHYQVTDLTAGMEALSTGGQPFAAGTPPIKVRGLFVLKIFILGMFIICDTLCPWLVFPSFFADTIYDNDSMVLYGHNQITFI